MQALSFKAFEYKTNFRLGDVILFFVADSIGTHFALNKVMMNERYVLAVIVWEQWLMDQEEMEALSSSISPKPIKWEDVRSKYKTSIPKECDTQLFNEKYLEVYELCHNKIKLSFYGEQDYPSQLLGVEFAPLVITYYGDLTILNSRRCLGVVGSRTPSSMVQQWFDHEFSKYMEKNNEIVVVSGGARGIDQLSHKAAIIADVLTVAVIPSGLSVIYPKGFKRWCDEIVNKGGCVLSSFFPNAEMRKYYFHKRNYLLSALVEGVFVVQAAKRSGTMITARYAADLGKDVYALSHFPHSSTSGGLSLVRDGAYLVVDEQDLPQC